MEWSNGNKHIVFKWLMLVDDNGYLTSTPQWEDDIYVEEAHFHNFKEELLFIMMAPISDAEKHKHLEWVFLKSIYDYADEELDNNLMELAKKYPLKLKIDEFIDKIKEKK